MVLQLIEFSRMYVLDDLKDECLKMINKLILQEKKLLLPLFYKFSITNNFPKIFEICINLMQKFDDWDSSMFQKYIF